MCISSSGRFLPMLSTRWGATYPPAFTAPSSGDGLSRQATTPDTMSSMKVKSRRMLPWLNTLIGWFLNMARSDEHTSELQSLMRIKYAVFCLMTKTEHKDRKNTIQNTRPKFETRRTTYTEKKKHR